MFRATAQSACATKTLHTVAELRSIDVVDYALAGKGLFVNRLVPNVSVHTNFRLVFSHNELGNRLVKRSVGEIGRIVKAFEHKILAL